VGILIVTIVDDHVGATGHLCEGRLRQL
jgi:hypothetical protein